jgi:small multidrug resistance pump
MAIGVAYGIWAATGVVLTALLAIPLFGERLTWVMGLGIAVVVGGVLLVELGSRSSS